MTAIEEILALTRTTTPSALSDDVLYCVLMTLPPAFVAAADGVLDDTERQFLFNMCDALADGEADDGTPKRALLTGDIHATTMGLMPHRHEIEGPLFAAFGLRPWGESPSGRSLSLHIDTTLARHDRGVSKRSPLVHDLSTPAPLLTTHQGALRVGQESPNTQTD
jgi:hypothetical protein